MDVDLVKEKREATSGQRPSDIWVRARRDGRAVVDGDITVRGGAGPGRQPGTGHTRHTETSYDIVVAATHKKHDHPLGEAPATATVTGGQRAREMDRMKRYKYRQIFQQHPTRALQPLAFESAGYATTATRKVLQKWRKAAILRLGPDHSADVGVPSTRRECSTIIHYWNAVCLIRRIGRHLPVIVIV